MPLTHFHPTVQRWFAEHLGAPTRPQAEGWPHIAAGKHVLIAAPTGTGKTLAAFLWSIDGLLRRPTDLGALEDRTHVLYVSPLRALSNDVKKNLERPLAEIRALDPALPEVRVLVRTGDTTATQRAQMVKRPPHVLVTTPESLYILLTSESGRRMLATVSTVIVDEIHAVARDKRGSHLALSLERLDHLCRTHRRSPCAADAPASSDAIAEAHGGGTPQRPQRIGLSATVNPLESVARLLCGTDRPCEIVDAGHLRGMDIDVVVPDTPLSAVCSHEQWGELYTKMAALVRAHKTTLAFVSTRKLAERLAARLTDELGAGKVACHHGSLSKETRLDAENRLKNGELAVLVATASLELGIDIGDVDLVLQIGSPRSIATLLQRVGRAGHGVARTPKGRLFPLTLDEALEAVALVRSLKQRVLDKTPAPPAALDILAQQIVAACAAEDWSADALFALFRRASPYGALTRVDFDAIVALHTRGRTALLHADGVGGRLMGTKRARLAAITSGGAIPDNADYRVVLEPENTFVGTLNEDFAIESSRGDIFQLGNTSWQIVKVEPGVVRVIDARGEPPTVPFWLGEAPSRTDELSRAIGEVRENGGDTQWTMRETGLGREVAEQVAEYLQAARAALGAMPSTGCIVLERFFDESGGQQLVVHSLFGSRVNRALGLALRKRFCRGFGFELQAAANEEAIVISLGQQHSFELEDVFRYLDSKGARDLLVQALLPAPMFTTRWRWNVGRSLLLPRMIGGKAIPPPIRRMRAEDLLARAFPQAIACGETLPPGDIPVPEDHPIVRQTIEDCLREAMDVDGFLALVRALERGELVTRAIDTSEPSPLAHGILAAQPYGFLDDAPLEERRTQAVRARRSLAPRDADEIGELDPAVIERVREEAWPAPEDAEELHESLLWMGFATDAECEPWRAWIDELAHARRAERVGDRWFAAEAPRAGKDVLRGRLEALGPVDADDPLIREFALEVRELEAEGAVLATRIAGRAAWCDRRLLARIHRATLEKLRAQVQAVSAADFLRFASGWQHATPRTQLEGPRGVAAVVEQLAGHHAPAEAWERSILPARVRGYRTSWLDGLSLTGEIAWGRLVGAGRAPARSIPVALFLRRDAPTWMRLRGEREQTELSESARAVLAQLETSGAQFHSDLARAAGFLPSQLDAALTELAGAGLATCDTFSGLRSLFARARAQRRRSRIEAPTGRWSLLSPSAVAHAGSLDAHDVEFVARALLAKYGIVFKRLLLRERVVVRWWDLLRAFRRMEARGEIHGGRFVAGFHGEQYALPQAVREVRAAREREGETPPHFAAADPLNLAGILASEPRVPCTARLAPSAVLRP
ncbi:MAG: DEAD/DEAH box helicase [Planctomycetota bacterium]